MSQKAKTTTFIAFTILYFVIWDLMLVTSGLSLNRVKRQNSRASKREEGSVDFNNIDENLYGWTPIISDRGCPPQQYACRDRSYCFKEKNLCNDIVSCEDQSDEINSICGYTTVSQMGTTPITESTSFSEEPKDTESRNRFSDPLVIAFLVFVASMLIYVVGTIVYCIKHRINAVRPHEDRTAARTMGKSQNANKLHKLQSQQNAKEQSEEEQHNRKTTNRIEDGGCGAINDVN
uniref:uncharacterized protein LOC120328432 n=1 Tax=Styela clava TaxID=7725 RepID=UPI00193A20EE|nr:uncharacterized protein LOC120328432 [Styela clava]